MVTEAWTFEMPPNTPTAAFYINLINYNDQPDKLLRVDIVGCDQTSLHQPSVTAHGLHMLSLDAGIDLPGNKTYNFFHEGVHVMCEGLANPFEPSDLIPMRLIFEKAEPIEAKAEVWAR